MTDLDEVEATVIEQLRGALSKTASRAHRTGCRPIDRFEAEFFKDDWMRCRNQECVEIRKVLFPPEPTLEEQLTQAINTAYLEFQHAQTGTETESFHNGRVTAYQHALELVQRQAELSRDRK